MKLVAWAMVTLLVWTLVPAALAAYDPGSALEADAPVVLSGRTDGLLTHGVASFVSADESSSLLLSARAATMSVEYHVARTTCDPASPTNPFPQGCATAPDAATEQHTLANAQLTITRALSAYKVILTDQDQYRRSSSFGAPGTLVASSGESTLLGSTTKNEHLCPADADWSDAPGSCASDSVYSVDALTADVTSAGGSLRALGGWQAMLQGVEVKVTGTDKDSGNAYSGTFRVASAKTEVQYLLVEATSGDLSATSAAPLSGYGVTTADTRGGATMQHATGHVGLDGNGADYKDQDATLAGPLSLAITRVKSDSNSAAPRLAFAISSDLHVADLATTPPKDDKTTQLVAAGAAGAGAAALLAGLVYFWPRLKFAGTLLFLPLYTRIERTAVLEHEKRDEIYELIRSSPGIHAHEIGERAHIGWGTTVYHLKLLESHSLVVSKKSGRYKRFFVNTGEYTKKKDVYGALRNETAKSVAQFIVDHPGCNQKEMCAALDIQPSLASWHVEKLEGVELVKRVKDGRMVRYFAGPAWSDLNVQILPGGGADTPAET